MPDPVPSDPARVPQPDPLLDSLSARLPDGYELADGMIYLLRAGGRAQPLCGPVLVRAQARGADGSGWCLDVAFRSFDGVWQSAIIPMRDLLKSPGRVVAGLVDRGLDLRGRAQDVCNLLRAMEVNGVSRALEVTGWVAGLTDVYVTPSGEILMRSGTADAQAYLFTGAARVAALPRADLAQAAAAWGARVVGASPSDAVTLGLCAAIAPVLLPVTDSPSFVLHLHGNDGAGRISRAVAASVWAKPGQMQLPWSTPLPQILSEIRAARDNLVLMTDYQPRHARKLPAIAEALAGLDASGPGRVVVLSTGGEPLLAEDGRTSAEQDLRNMIDIDVRGWITQDADTILAAAAAHAGSFGPACLQSLIDWNVWTKKGYIQARMVEINDILTGPQNIPLDAETERLDLALGAMYSAGAYVAKREMLEGFADPKAFFARLVEMWVSQARGALSTDDRMLLAKSAAHIRNLLRDNSLAPLDTPTGAVARSETGWHDTDHVYLTGQTVATIASENKVPLDRLLSLLLSQKLLLQGRRERGYQFKLPSRVPNRPRAYRISREILRYAAVGDD
jgi:hypothetical protein